MPTPLVCFYKNEDFIYSDNYTLKISSAQENSTDFLNIVQKHHPNELKIIQINFEYQSTVRVYILHQHQIKNKSELTSDLKSLSILFKPDINKDVFISKVNQIKQDISQGRYYQVNFTSRFSAVNKTQQDSFELFKYYLGQFKSQYSAYLPLENQSEILCYSPELFLEKENTAIKTQPIKGTSQATENIDLLLNNHKENAELSMIVDLLRNDLQSVCDKKVQVSKHREPMLLNYVTHTYSEISGTTQQRLPEILERMLPAGSISGCPKAESLKAIAEYELNERGFYTGCIGWWQNDDFKLNLAIRSFLNTEKDLTYYSGCGIVYDSDAEKEWVEFNNKAKHLPRLKIIDTFKKDQRLPLHIQRSFEAAKQINNKITFQDVETLYAQIISNEKLNKKYRIEFNPFDLEDLKIETSELDPIVTDLPFKISTDHSQLPGIGLQNFKTNDRSYWQHNSTKDFEILGVNRQGFVTETARFNFFVKIQNTLYTPSLKSGCLNGCLRQQGLQSGLEINNQIYPVQEQDFTPTDLAQYSDFYLGNSLRGLQRAHLIKD